MLQPSSADRSLKAMSSSNNITILPSFCIGICISIFVLPISWIFAWLTAALVHELGHMIALKALKVPVFRIKIGFNGASIEAGYLSAATECISALAGPLAGLTCLFFSRYAPFVAVCGFVHSIYNLLPYPAFDGGRALKVIISMLLPQGSADNVYQCIIVVLSVAFILVGLYLWIIVHLGPIFFAFTAIPVLKSGIIKIPCKRR